MVLQQLLEGEQRDFLGLSDCLCNRT
jgi:hypothetical protein